MIVLNIRQRKNAVLLYPCNQIGNKADTHFIKKGRGFVRIVKMKDRTVTYHICMSTGECGTMCRMCKKD